MNVELKRLSPQDGMDIYEMLQSIPRDENGFMNGVNGMTYAEYQAWLIRDHQASLGTEIVDGWKVPSTTYWLYVDGMPVGIGRLRHFLTDKLREEGGNVGYGIAPAYRGKGYGKLLLSALVAEARKKGVPDILATVHNDNIPSLRAMIACGGRLVRVNEQRHYFRFDAK